MVYLICGKARTGKDTFSEFMKEYLEENGHKVCNIQLMRTLKGYVKDYFGWDGTEENKPRELLQKYGTEIIAQKLNKPTFHIDHLIEDIEVLSVYFDTFIVDDVRFPKEIDALRNHFQDIKVIHITREVKNSNMTEEEQKHISELALDSYQDFDLTIENNGTLEELKAKAEKLISEGDFK